MDVSQAQDVKQLRDENARLKKLVADLSLDKDALQLVIKKTGGARGDEGNCRAGVARSTPSVSGGRAG
jgi:putative transposase